MAGEIDGSKFYFAYDQVGSLRAVTDDSGTVVKTVRYDSFGNIIEDTNSDLTVPFGFAGGLHDRDTGLVRFGYRDYDPDTGRWTAKDPIGFRGGDVTVYGYVEGNPVNRHDELGLEAGELDGAACPSGAWDVCEWKCGQQNKICTGCRMQLTSHGWLADRYDPVCICRDEYPAEDPARNREHCNRLYNLCK